ncbi:MAG: hypothetical protein KIT40_08975 [Nitrospira sp.]|nr:hypothetical protein [Nitrospira sp.]
MAGPPSPLGATWDGEGLNVALFFENATAAELCLFEGPDATRESSADSARGTDHSNWPVYLPEGCPGLHRRKPSRRTVRALPPVTGAASIERHRHIVASRGSPYWAVRVQGPRCIAPSVSCVQYRKGGDPRRVPLRPQVDLPRSSTHPIDASNHKAFPSLSTR